jgi:hypothetical protein
MLTRCLRRSEWLNFYMTPNYSGNESNGGPTFLREAATSNICLWPEEEGGLQLVTLKNFEHAFGEVEAIVVGCYDWMDPLDVIGIYTKGEVVHIQNYDGTRSFATNSRNPPPFTRRTIKD